MSMHAEEDTPKPDQNQDQAEPTASVASSRPRAEKLPYLVEYPELPQPVDWSVLFGNTKPVELEIGSGKGLFLANEGKKRPDTNFFGIEVARKYARRAAERAFKRELTNVRVLPGDALLFLSKYTTARSLDAVHIYFPDPWWKKRHRKRRVFCETLVLDIEKALKPNGDLWVVTDVHEYFEVMLGLMEQHPGFAKQPEPVVKDPLHELDYLTNFERKYRIEGRPIYRVHYRWMAEAQV